MCSLSGFMRRLLSGAGGCHGRKQYDVDDPACVPTTSLPVFYAYVSLLPTGTSIGKYNLTEPGKHEFHSAGGTLGENRSRNQPASTPAFAHAPNHDSADYAAPLTTPSLSICDTASPAHSRTADMPSVAGGLVTV
jgi:hypothetical protein